MLRLRSPRPASRIELDSELRPSSPWAARGQILIMFAVMLTALLGALGLSVDLGMAFAQRRSMQSAADAAAYAGTRMVAKQNVDSVPTSVLNEVTAVVNSNNMNGNTISSID